MKSNPIFFIPMVLMLFASEMLTAQNQGDQHAIIKNQILTRLRTLTEYKVPNASMFSRCPSGLSYRVDEYAVTNRDFTQGRIIFYDGCRSTDVCRFRVRTGDGLAELEQNGSFVSVDAWMSAREKPAGNKSKSGRTLVSM